MSEAYERDELYETVFNTNEGKAALGGFAVGLVTAVPAWGILFALDPGGSARTDQSHVNVMISQAETLDEASTILAKQGNNELADEVADASSKLTGQASLAESQVPPHVSGDVAFWSLALTPVLIGAASGAALYRYLKRQKI